MASADDFNMVLNFDFQDCHNWTLQRNASDGLTFIRCVEDSEFDSIRNAASFCRKYASRTSFRLLNLAYDKWKSIIENPSEIHTMPDAMAQADEAIGSLVSWLLTWRLTSDQTAHDLSYRFGKESQELATFREAQHLAYDQHQGYRLAEAIRNSVQHREMPAINLGSRTTRNPKTKEVIVTTTPTMPIAWLLDSEKCPRIVKKEFESRRDEDINLSQVVDDAMTGIGHVINAVVQIDFEELSKHMELLRKLFDECKPGLAWLCRYIPRESAGPIEVEMSQLDDLFPLLNAGIQVVYLRQQRKG